MILYVDSKDLTWKSTENCWYMSFFHRKTSVATRICQRNNT